MKDRVIEALEQTEDQPVEDRAEAVIRAITYRDGVDESTLIDVTCKYQIEPVSFIEAWDAMLERALAE